MLLVENIQGQCHAQKGPHVETRQCGEECGGCVVVIMDAIPWIWRGIGGMVLLSSSCCGKMIVAAVAIIDCLARQICWDVATRRTRKG